MTHRERAHALLVPFLMYDHLRDGLSAAITAALEDVERETWREAVKLARAHNHVAESLRAAYRARAAGTTEGGPVEAHNAADHAEYVDLCDHPDCRAVAAAPPSETPPAHLHSGDHFETCPICIGSPAPTEKP